MFLKVESTQKILNAYARLCFGINNFLDGMTKVC